MTLQIDFAPQIEEWINSEAQQLGVLPADLVRRFVEERASATTARSIYKTPQERIRAMDALIEKYADRPFVPDSVFDRDNVYEDRL